MERKKVSKVLFKKESLRDVKWIDIKNFEFQDNDIIDIEYDEDRFVFVIKISRLVDETDEELERRIKQQQASKEHLKKIRYQNFLELKKEFEPEN